MMPKEILTVILLVLLIVCAISVNIVHDLLQSVIIFMAYSSIMADRKSTRLNSSHS